MIASIASKACVLLLAAVTLTLAQDQCRYGYLPHSPTSPNWPDCLLNQLPNVLNGTYYITPEGTDSATCPEQPCLTFIELRDQFFVLNDGYMETITSGDTYLVFLPGTHYIHGITEDIIGVGGILSLSGSVYDPPPTIECEFVFIGIERIRILNGIYFSNFSTVVLHNLRFNNCVVDAWQDGHISIDRVIFNSFLDIRNVDSVNVTDSSGVGLCDSQYNERNGAFNFNFSQAVRFTNVSLSADTLPCSDILKLFTFNTGNISIVDSTFLGDANHVILRNATFDSFGEVYFQNGRTAIQALSSRITLAGNVSFVNNTGYQGGAMSLTESLINVIENAYVVFKGNRAEFVGGAIYDSGNHISNYVSIGQTIGLPTIESHCVLSFGANSRVEFISNRAESGGSALYSIALSRSVCVDGIDPSTLTNNSLVIDPDNISAVSSDPLRVCICSDEYTPDCLAILSDQNIPGLRHTVYPGQNFTVPAAVVGFNFALTSGSVYAQFRGNSDASLGSESQLIQNDNNAGCFPLEYSVLSDKKKEILVLTTNRRNVTGIPASIMKGIDVLNNNTEGFSFINPLQDNYIANLDKYYVNGTFMTNLTDGIFRLTGYLPRPLQDTPVFISVSLLPCPPGFTLSDKPYQCECNERLVEHRLACNINTQTVRRERTTWVNATFSGNTSNGVIVHEHCPLEYCNQDPVYVDLTDPDQQCALGHSGILCGACQPNFSLALGNNRCLPNCSNSNLSLLIPFAIAGFVLVFFIKILNLTVSQGTINGLIFYASIVATKKTLFFPTGYNGFLAFLSVFIAWLNLDFGFQSCFIYGLDAYWKTWLQFMFPFYVWGIAGGIIAVSHYSKRATKLFGSNSLSVLATLFLLSYAKMLRTIITVFGFTTLKYPDNSTTTIWAFDGNVEYFSPKHIPLFLFALAIHLLLWLPYTTILLSARWLRTQSHRKNLRWLKPFLDAYSGPLKDKHHYWIGVLLIVRGVLFVLFATVFAVNVSLLLVSISCIFLLAFPGSVYKTLYLTILENSFILNLGVLAAGTSYNRLVDGNQETLTTISVGITFFQFIGIAIFHCYYYIIKNVMWREWIAIMKKKHTAQYKVHDLETPFVASQAEVSHTEVYLLYSEANSTAEDAAHALEAITDQVQSSAEPTDKADCIDRTSQQADQDCHHLPPLAKSANTTDTMHIQSAMQPGADVRDSPKYFTASTVFESYSSPRESLLFKQ